MDKKILLPELDEAVLQKKAQEAAMKGATDAITEFYCGYNSPYKKKIIEELQSQSSFMGIKLPHIIGLINEALNAEVTRIANASIAETFLPLVTKALTQVDKQIKFSDILQEFIICHRIGEDDKPKVSIEESRHGWLEVELTWQDMVDKNEKYKLTLHQVYKVPGKYCILSLPYVDGDLTYKRTMRLTDGRMSLEMPFTRAALQDKFTSYIASIVLCKSEIEMDADDFEWEEED